jgi:hypothetical protein
MTGRSNDKVVELLAEMTGLELTTKESLNVSPGVMKESAVSVLEKRPVVWT